VVFTIHPQYNTTLSRPVFTTALEAEAAFYRALSEGDFEALMAVWSEEEEVVCVQPGGPRIVGLAAVREIWRQILADGAPVVAVLRALGLVGETSGVYPSAVAVIAGLTYNFLPFMTLPIYASLERVDPRLVEASGDLYAKPFTGFRKVTWPLSMPGVVAGTLLTFIPAAGDYINAELLGSAKDRMIGNAIQTNFIEFRDYPIASSLSFILMAIILVLVFAYIRRAGTEDLV